MTCPCHLPILAAVLAGTTAGAFIGEHWAIAAIALTSLFILSGARLLRVFKERS
ncbi:MAG: broad-spectrum mercury transporter MerE [Burkholderiales bacterium]|nr:broad-spectrum mercury transporter MerE [Burkholderiales bacterium]